MMKTEFSDLCTRILVLVVGLGLMGACTYTFPGADSQETFACESNSDCVSGYECVDGFCAQSGTAGGDSGGGGGDGTGGDPNPPGDPTPPLGQHNLQVTLSGTGTGSVTSTPARINCPGTCLAAFDENNTVTLTAAPGVDSILSGFSGCTSTAGLTCSVLMNANKTITVNFNLAPTAPPVEIKNVVSGAGRVTGGGMTFDVQVGGGLAPTKVGDGTTEVEAGSNLHPKQQR